MNFVDKKVLLRKSLANIMVDHRKEIQDLVSIHGHATAQTKEDLSPVTALDYALSALVEEIALRNYPEFTFYSEEKFSKWSFPLMALDPLDGTREFLASRPEWAISIGLLINENFTGEGWIYNPKTEELFTSESKNFLFKEKVTYLGECSRSEWESGLFTNKNVQKFEIVPMGSIAYKLGRLSAGEIDFVVSKRPKNIWDIAAGTLLCKQAGLNFYSQGRPVTKVQKKYDPPLIWCHEKMFSELSEIFS